MSVYGGGHNVTGNAVCDDGVTIDLRPMKGIEVDPETRTCRAEAGLTWGELDAATQEHGLAVTGGRMSTTGLGGLVLGGGSGWIERKCGYAVDNLLSVEIVTADGQILTASETREPGPLLGHARRRRQLRRRDQLRAPAAPDRPDRPGRDAAVPGRRWRPRCCANFRDVMAEAPDEVGSGVALLTAPPEEFVPEPVRGQPVVGVIVCYAGPVEEGEAGAAAAARVRPAGDRPGRADAVRRPAAAHRRGYPAGMRNYWTGDFLTGLPDEAIEVLCRFHLSKPSPLTQILMLPGGGASARVPDGTMAIGERRGAVQHPHHLAVAGRRRRRARTSPGRASSAPR